MVTSEWEAATEGGEPFVPDRGLLLQLQTDRRLGHEWDDWDGEALPDGGDFAAPVLLFFELATVLFLGVWGTVALIGWLLTPRLEALGSGFPGSLQMALAGVVVLALAWLTAIAAMYRSGTSWLPARLAERGPLPALMPWVERLARIIGVSRDRAGNAMLRLHNRLAMARGAGSVRPEELLILLPRCLGKEAMRSAMRISSAYGVPLFVASRGRYAREMIGRRRPRAVVAVACERDLVSGVHDVGGRLPVLGSTLRLPDGPCRNTTFTSADLETQVRRLLGMDEQAGGGSRAGSTPQ